MVGGFTFARHLASYQLAIVAGFVPVGEPPEPFRIAIDEITGEEMSIGVQVGETTWLPRHELPEPRHPERDGRDVMYDTDVAGRTLAETLAAALRFFRKDVWRD